jgi:Ca-activated chloride channel family protein
MQTEATQKAAGSVEVRFSNSKDEVKKNLNKHVTADVVELLAVERNEMAMKLRDEGRLGEARQKLKDNVLYLQTAASDSSRAFRSSSSRNQMPTPACWPGPSGEK